MNHDPGHPHRPQDEGADFNQPTPSRQGPQAAARQSGLISDGTDLTPGLAQLLPPGEREKLEARLQQALHAFVEHPYRAVEEADNAFDETVVHLTEALKEQGRILRASWQSQDSEAHTEALRRALRDYQEIIERLLRL